ncbi:MAG: hypothetical protein ABW000_07295 [Actinoplanes sp.]
MGAVTFQAGMRLTPSRLNSLPKGEIYRAQRPSQATITTSETGILRVDDALLLAGRRYAIRVPRLRIDFSTTSDRAAFRLRVNAAGLATTTSPSIARAETGDVQSVGLEGTRRPTVNETVSILLSGTQYAGTSTATVQGLDEGGIEIIVEDLGLAVPDTGIDI